MYPWPTEFYVNEEYVVTIADVVEAFAKLGWQRDKFAEEIIAEWNRQMEAENESRR